MYVLPEGCEKKELNLGKCNPDPSNKSRCLHKNQFLDIISNTCNDQVSEYCCGEVDSKIIKIKCQVPSSSTEYDITLKQIMSCGCRKCSELWKLYIYKTFKLFVAFLVHIWFDCQTYVYLVYTTIWQTRLYYFVNFLYKKYCKFFNTTKDKSKSTFQTDASKSVSDWLYRVSFFHLMQSLQQSNFEITARYLNFDQLY